MKRLIKFLLGLAVGATAAALVTPKSGQEMRKQLLAGVSDRLLPSSSDSQTLLEQPPAEDTRAAEPPESLAPPEAAAEPAPEPEPWFRPVPPPEPVAATPPFAAEAPAEEAPAVEAEAAPEAEPLAEAAPEAPPGSEPTVEDQTPAPEPAVQPSGQSEPPEHHEPTEPAAGEPIVDENVSAALAADVADRTEPEEPAWNAGVAAAVEPPLYAEPPADEGVETLEAESEDLKPRIEATRAAIESEIAQPFIAPVERTDAEEPEVQQPPVEDAVAEAPAWEPELAAEEPAVEEAEAAAPSWRPEPVEEPSVEGTIAEEPAVEELAVEEPAVEEPTVETRPWEPEPTEEPAVPQQGEVPVPPPLAPSPFASGAPAPPPYVVPSAPPEERAAWGEQEEPAADVSEPAAIEEPPVAGVPYAIDTPAVEEPAAEAPAAEAPAAEAPAAEAPATDAPAAEAPSEAAAPPAEAAAPPAEAPPAEAAPVAEDVSEGPSIDQAEMRRRIEETRARLKAKAFDAMMSGEAALLSRDSGERPVPEGDVDLDSEASAQLDEGLSPDDS